MKQLRSVIAAACLAAVVNFSVSAHAASGDSPAPASAAAPDSIVIYFASGSTTVRPEDMAQLDHAARLFRQASPIIMQVSGTADAVGNPDANLRLSEKRANAVLRGLVDRGIPVSRFQVLAKGVTEPAVQAPPGVSEEKNRLVKITWR